MPVHYTSRYPTVLLGGMDKRVFERIVEWGDGWIPARVTVEEIPAGRAELHTQAERLGKDPQTFEVIAFSMPGEFRTREELRTFEQAGANHVTLWLTQTEGEEALFELKELAAEIF